ncbi:hypothetical protein [Anatilimnocola floriformis]|uniref:hypothetical protein n=1 Tax=Anatilimnocola floriformis TaxID=2948575 RepID=UPI0020C59895|nr:hypothetical protein [Anatilimnocola floriformis]
MKYLLALLFIGVAAVCLAAEPAARFVSSHGDAKGVELVRGESRAILSPAGGRVLEFSVGGKQALWFDETEKSVPAGKQRPMSAGRFDIGPELTIAAHPKLWAGDWKLEITGEASAMLTSEKDEASGMQLRRYFTLNENGGLSCKQLMTNISADTKEVCHWGRSFSPGGGICLIPLVGQSKFPSKYAMYEDSAIINVRNQDEKIRERDGFLEILSPPRKPKLGFDSYAGWLAYVMPGDVLFVKRWSVQPNRVYNEAAGLTLSVWYPAGARIELEPIGPREVLQPQQSAAFTEHWFVLQHPFPKAGESVDLVKLRAQVEGLWK